MQGWLQEDNKPVTGNRASLRGGATLKQEERFNDGLPEN